MTKDFDVIVIGAGPAGANAARVAANAGANVALIDEQQQAGGQVWRDKNRSIKSAPTTPETRAGNTLRHALKISLVTHFCNARVWQIEPNGNGWHIHFLIGKACQTLTCKSLVLATGAREYIQPIPGWTTPGVLGLAGATALFKQSMTLPGQNTIVSGTGPLVFFVASEIRRLGGKVAAIVTSNSRMDWLRALPKMTGRPALLARGALWMADLKLAGIPIYWDHTVTTVSGTTHVDGVSINQLDQNGFPQTGSKTIQTDNLCLGNGLIPNIEALHMLGTKLDYNTALGGWVPDADDCGKTSIDGLYVCGDAAGIRGAEAAVHQGILTGFSIADNLGLKSEEDAIHARQRKRTYSAWKKATRFGLTMTAMSIPSNGLASLATKQTIICRCENLTRASIDAEILSGAGTTNAVKSGIRAGMGACGGKFCQTAVAHLIAHQTSVPLASISPPTPRPPLRPVPLSLMAGEFDYDELPIPKPAPL